MLVASYRHNKEAERRKREGGSIFRTTKNGNSRVLYLVCARWQHISFAHLVRWGGGEQTCCICTAVLLSLIHI